MSEEEEKDPSPIQHEEVVSREKCPFCGDALDFGFGLAGGGFGSYLFCHTCGKVISKTSTED